MTSPPDQIPCFFINLDQAKVRKRHMQAQAQAVGVDLQRISAINGALLDDDTCKTHNPRTLRLKPLTRSEIGCFLSHRKAWSAVTATGHPWGCVLEDDLDLSDDMGRYLQTPSWIPDGIGLIKLETFGNRNVILSKDRVDIPHDRGLAQIRLASIGTGGYLLSSDTAAALLAATQRFVRPVDDLIFSEKLNPVPDLRIWQIIPALCIQQKNAQGQIFLPDNAEASSIIDSSAGSPAPPSGLARGIYYARKKLRHRKHARLARRLNSDLGPVPFRK